MRILIFTALMMTVSLASATEIVDQTLAQVSDHVLTSREIFISEAIDKARAVMNQKKIDPGYWSMTEVKSKNYETLISQNIFEIILYLEAQSFNVAEVSNEQIKTSDAGVSQILNELDKWKELGVSNSEFQQILTRKLRAKSFLKFKTESTGVIIADDEAQSYFEKNRAKFGQFPFEQFKESIKEFLSQQQLQIKLKDWYELLKKKYKLRLLLSNEIQKNSPAAK